MHDQFGKKIKLRKGKVWAVSHKCNPIRAEQGGRVPQTMRQIFSLSKLDSKFSVNENHGVSKDIMDWKTYGKYSVTIF